MMDDAPPFDLHSAFKQLKQPLLNFLKRRLGNPCDAEDLVQESFTRWAAAERGGVVAQRPKQFVFQIAANLACDHLRRRSRQEDVFVECRGTASLSAPAELDLPEIADEPSVDPAVRVEHREALALLEAAIAGLPERQRQVLLLSRIEGLTQEQIAERLGISRRMVVRHLSHALAYCELRTQYGDAVPIPLDAADPSDED